jgi:two-component system, sensor histidine kinase
MSRRKTKAKSVRRTRESSRVRKSAQAAAVEAALAGIAHDIRTPLTGIVALAELLASSDLGPREREWADAIKSGADHLAALSTLIVDAAKANVRGLVFRNEPFSPRLLAEVVGTALAARASNKALSTDVKIASDLPAMVQGDALRLRAALENLADNA